MEIVDVRVVRSEARLEVARDVFFYGQNITSAELGYAPGIGYLALEEAGEQFALGFYAPTNPYHVPPDQLEPATTLGEVPLEYRVIKRQGKGVGPRLYNTPEGVMSAHEEPHGVGAYLFNVGAATILDARKPSDHAKWGKAMRVASHAGRIVEAKLRPNGLQKVTDRIHKSYKHVDLVLMNQPPNPARRQRARGYLDPPNCLPSFMIVRNPDLNILKVGELGVDFYERARAVREGLHR